MSWKIVITLIVMLVILIPAAVYADSSITLINSGTKVDFPASLTFNIKAESQAPITRIRLRYTVQQMTYTPTFAEVWPDFKSDKSVSTSWSWDMRTGDLPPGAEVNYWWVIEDSSGNTLTTPQQTVSFDDTNHKWTVVSEDNIFVHWYDGNTDFGNSLLKAASTAKNVQQHDTGALISKPVNVYIYGSQPDLLNSMISAQEWTGGRARPEFDTILLFVAPSDLDWGQKALAHEMGHLVTHQITSGPYGATLPPWLDEGLAMHAEGPQSDSDLALLKSAVSSGNIPTLQSLSSPFSADPQEAYLDYAESQSVIDYLISKFGNDKMNQLLVNVNNGYSMDDALTKVYGFNMDGLFSAWLNTVTPAPNGNEVQHNISRLEVPAAAIAGMFFMNLYQIDVSVSAV
ncbi:MAG: peptidase MA family metallohydrolase [Dehalococcoidia bacterium]